MKTIDIIDIFKSKYLQFVWIFLVLGYTTFFLNFSVTQQLSRVLLIISALVFVLAKMTRDGFFVSKDNVPWVTVIFSLFCFWMYISRYWGETPDMENKAFYFEMHFLFPVAISLDLMIDSREKNDRILEAFIYAITICAIITTVTTPVSSWGDAHTYGGITPLHRNSASMIFVIAFAISLYCYSLKRKIIYIVCDVILIAANLITGSRKGIIQLALVVVIYMLLNNSAQAFIKYVLIIVLIAAIVAVAFYYIPWLQEMFGQRFLAVFDDSIEDGSRDIRTVFRKLAFQEFLKHPIIGNGYESFSLVNEAYTGIKVYSHCNFTELLSNYGIIGFGLYYLNYIVSLIIGFKNRNDNLGKMIIYTLIPAIVIEYGQVDYYSLHAFVALVMTFFSAKVLYSQQKESELS